MLHIEVYLIKLINDSSTLIMLFWLL